MTNGPFPSSIIRDLIRGVTPLLPRGERTIRSGNRRFPRTGARVLALQVTRKFAAGRVERAAVPAPFSECLSSTEAVAPINQETSATPETPYCEERRHVRNLLFCFVLAPNVRYPFPLAHPFLPLPLPPAGFSTRAPSFHLGRLLRPRPCASIS